MESANTPPSPTAPPTLSAAEPAPPRARGPGLRQIAVVVAILAAGLLLTKFTTDVRRMSEPGVLLDEHQLPFLAEHVGGWTGGPSEGLSQAERDILPKDTEGARRLYKDGHGHELYCSVVLAGADVTSIHRPEICLPAQGWTIQSEHVESIPLESAPGGELQLMRMNTVHAVPGNADRNLHTRSIFAYWFIGKDRNTPYHWKRMYWTTKDRVLHNTNHRWAYLLVHGRVADPEPGPGADPAAQETMQLIAQFVQNLYPTLVVQQ